MEYDWSVNILSKLLWNDQSGMYILLGYGLSIYPFCAHNNSVGRRNKNMGITWVDLNQILEKIKIYKLIIIKKILNTITFYWLII